MCWAESDSKTARVKAFFLNLDGSFYRAVNVIQKSILFWTLNFLLRDSGQIESLKISLIDWFDSHELAKNFT